MSTRCQVKVVRGPDRSEFSDNITLYHHCDGYPGNMLEVIGRAWGYANRIPKYWRDLNKDRRDGNKYNPFSYQLDRPGYVASYLCHTDPHDFQPLPYHDLHGDIEWYYILDVDIKSLGEEWKIFLYKAKMNMEGPVDLTLVMEGRISDFLTRKNKVRKDVVEHIIKETEGSYIGVELCGEKV